MRWWGWWRMRSREVANGDAAHDALREADEALSKAHDQDAAVDRTAWEARALARHSSRFARDVERALHLRGHA